MSGKRLRSLQPAASASGTEDGARGERHFHRVFGARRTSLRARWRWSAPASSPWGGLKPGPIPGHARCHRECDRTDRVQSHHGNRAVVFCYPCRPASAASTSRGKTIMPGIVDVHGHVTSESSGLLAQSSWPLAANLAFGVTTSHDPSNDSETVFTNAEMIRSGAKLGPRFYSTGTVLYGAERADQGGHRELRRRRSRTCGGRNPSARSPLKSYNQQRRDVRQMIIKAGARARGDGRAGGRLAGLHGRDADSRRSHRRRALAAGAASSTRMWLQLFAKSKVGLPTLIVSYGGLSGEYYWYQHKQRLGERTAAALHAARSCGRALAAPDDGRARTISITSSLRKARSRCSMPAGRCSSARTASCRGSAPIGSCGCCSRAACRRWMRCARQRPTVRVISASTPSWGRSGRATWRISWCSTAIPLDDIRNSESLAFVMLNGRLYDAKTLDEIGDTPRLRRPFWFEPPERGTR